MHINYFDMLCGAPIFIEDVGHLRSPALRELTPITDVDLDGHMQSNAYMRYVFYVNFLSFDKEGVLKFDSLVGERNVSMLSRSDLGLFDTITLIKHTREVCREALSFFITEDVKWDNIHGSFAVVTNRDGEEVKVGEINRNNYEEVKKMILQLNYIGLESDEVQIKHSSEKTKELWERAQAFLKEQTKKGENDKPEYRLSNIISKICAVHPSYNLFNIYNLTIFQLYDTFFQIGYIRASNLNENIFSNHGGEKFSLEDWLKPILKNI